MGIKKSIKTKVTQEIEIPLEIIADVKPFGKSGAHVITPKRWISKKVKVTILAIAFMLVLSSFTMAGPGLAFAAKSAKSGSDGGSKGGDKGTGGSGGGGTTDPLLF